MLSEQKPKPSNLSTAKLILAAVILISLSIVLGVAGYLMKNKEIVNSQSQILSTPEPVNNVSDWKTYTNQEYGFEIKYPSIWSYNDGPLPYTFYFGNSGPYEYQVGVWITPTSNINKTDKQCKTIVLEGKPGWKCEGEQWSDTEHGVKTGYMVKHIYVEVENYGKFYYFSVAASEQNALDKFSFFNQMLSTFKFTNITEVKNTIINPNKQSVWKAGETHLIQWTQKDSNGTVDIRLNDNTAIDNATHLVFQASISPKDTGNYSFMVSEGLETGNRYQFIITQYLSDGSRVNSLFSEEFTIIGKD